MDFKNQKFFILGLSASGFAVAERLYSFKAKTYFYEENNGAKTEEYVKRALELGAERVYAENAEEIILDVDVMVISPGVAINHEFAVFAKRNGKRILGELEFGLLTLSPRLVAVTGTNGKTTTVSLIDHLLNSAEINSVLCGNVGLPLTTAVKDVKSDSVIVAEVSSFQLESCSINPHVSCFLNFSEDHLKRHYTMENYLYLKSRIFKNQRESEYAVLNYDDETVRGFSEQVKAKVIYVSAKERVDGAYFKDGIIYFMGEEIAEERDLPLRGIHNLYNALFAVAVAKILGVKSQDVLFGLKGFKGVPHRYQTVCDINGITFINDSKATNTSSTISALKTLDRDTVLILGGSEKGEDYANLFESIKNSFVRHTVITGASKRNMLGSAIASGYYDLTAVDDFDTAVKIAYKLARQGENVLLSPATASFDKFSSFEERGERFIKLTEEFSCLKEV